MSLTITPNADPSTSAERFVIGDRRCVVGSITFDDAYPADGEAITAADLGFDFELDYIQIGLSVDGTAIAVWDVDTEKILAYLNATGVQVADDEVEDVVFPFLAIGK